MGVYNPKYTGIYVGKDKYITNEEVCDILARIVGCDSVTGHEGACGRVIASICEEYGLKYEMVEADENRPNVMITLGADSYLDKKLGLLFEGHYDTVPVMEMEHPFDTAIVDNKMWGRGIVDQKSGVVSALCAAIAVKRSGKTLKKPICVALVIDEESEHRGGYALAESKLQAEYAFTTEPTNRVTCEFGCCGTTPIRIHIKGLTAHASTPYRGINSIQKALPILNALFALEFPEVDLGKFGVYRNSICVSMIEAGSAYNNVPGEAVATNYTVYFHILLLR